MVIESHSEADTWAAAARLASTLVPGDVVTLEGCLGAGKTTFMQGLCAALGAQRVVTSPTFCLVSEHPTKNFLLVHMDLYRLTNEEDVLAIGWEDYLSRGAVLAVEWSDRAGSLVPPNAKRIRITLGETPNIRIIEMP